MSAEAEVGVDTVDSGLPSRLLDDVLARSEFAGSVTNARNPLQDAIERLAAAWSQLPTWVDTILTGVVLAAAAALVIWLLADVGVFGRHRRRAARESGPAAEVGATTGSAAALFREGREAHAAGRLAEAITLLFRAMVARLVERGLLLDDPSRTNREHLRDLRRREREAAALRSATPAFERVRYGEMEPAVSDADDALAAALPLFPAEPR